MTNSIMNTLFPKSKPPKELLNVPYLLFSADQSSDSDYQTNSNSQESDQNLNQQQGE